VTVPPAYQQSRGATFRDSRLRRIPSRDPHGTSEQFSHSSSKNHQEDSESYEEESNASGRHSKRPNHSGYEQQQQQQQQPQGISSLASGEDKTLYHSSSSHGSQHDYQHQQQSQVYNSGMIPQMHQHSMYPQGPYHQQQQQPSGPYYPQNQLR
jgi:hypothetical protein